MRHGNSVTSGPGHLKALSTRGEKEVSKVGGWLQKNKINPKAIWHSPLPRAAQTATLIQKAIGFPGEGLIEKPELVPEGNPTGIIREIYTQNSDLILVSHLPFLKGFACHFFDPETTPEAFEFHTAGICALDLVKGKSLWLWTLSPDDL